MSRLPIYLNRHIGFAMNRMLQEDHPVSDQEIRRQLAAQESKSLRYARPVTLDQIDAIMRRARANVNATRRVQATTGRASLKTACGFKCEPGELIGLRVEFTYQDRFTGLTRTGSTIISVPAETKRDEAIRLARHNFLQLAQSGRFQSGSSPADPDSVSEGVIQSVARGGFEGAAEFR